VNKSFVKWTLAVIGALLTFGGEQAQAQPIPRAGFGRTNAPVYSPWLNMFNPNQTPLQNYFGTVQPQFEFRNAYQGLQQQVSANDQAIGGLETASTLPTTGHATRFLSTGRYFLNSVGQGGRASTVVQGTGNRPTTAGGQGMASQTSRPLR